MRSRLALGFALLALALCAWWFVGTAAGPAHARPESVRAAELPCAAEQTEAQAADVPGAQPERRTAGLEVRFEPCARKPSELLVHIRKAGTHEPLPGVDLFALEVDQWQELFPSLSDGEPTPDFELLLREGGRRYTSDEQGDVRLAMPTYWAKVTARKENWFGAACVGFADPAETVLELYASADCVVRTRTRAGRPAPDVALTLISSSAGICWNGRTDANGETRIPNLAWLLCERGYSGEAWCVAVNDACAAPPVKWIQRSEPLPASLELELPDASELRLRVLAHDGTAVPIRGRIFARPRDWAGSDSRMHLPRPAFPQANLVDGEARLGLTEPGGGLDADVNLAGGERFMRTVHVPADATGELTLDLRLPGHLQALLARPVDASGAALAGRSFEWVHWKQKARGELAEDQQSEPLRSDARGLLAFVIRRPELHEQLAGESEPVADGPEISAVGVLRMATGGLVFESAPIAFDLLGVAAFQDLGTLALRPAAPLVRGRVLDDTGLPVAGVSLNLRQLRSEAGEEISEGLEGCTSGEAGKTDSEGKFALFGSCPGGILELLYLRSGFVLPAHDASTRFQCGSSPELALRLVRTGSIATSLILPPQLKQFPSWEIEGPDYHDRFDLLWPRARNRNEQWLEEVPPGTYRVRLIGPDASQAPMLDVENVIVQPGMTTLDPRLLEIDLTHSAMPAGEPELRAQDVPGPAVDLRVLDSAGDPVLEGIVEPCFTDWENEVCWHGGVAHVGDFPSNGSICVWSPGFRAFIGRRPAHSQDLKLEPAWQLGLRVEIPTELRKPGWRFVVRPALTEDPRSIPRLVNRMAPAEVGSDGYVSFECPLECDLDFVLEALALDPLTHSCSRENTPTRVTHLVLHVPAGNGSHVLSATTQEWAAAREVLSGEH